MIVKVHNTPNGRMLAICDSDLLGKVFDEGDLQLNLSSQFYQGQEKAAPEIEMLLKDCYMVNVVGKEAVSFLVELEMVDKDNILTIAGIPYAQCVVDR